MLSKFNAQFIKIGGHIINLNNICDVQLNWVDDDAKIAGVAIEFPLVKRLILKIYRECNYERS